MKGSGRNAANHAMEVTIGHFLRGGVILAASVVFIGGLIYLFRHGMEGVHYSVFQRVPADLCTISGILNSALSFHGRGFIQLGLLLLIATPLARVVYSFFAFLRQRDFLYTIITSVVLCVLAYSLFHKQY